MNTQKRWFRMLSAVLLALLFATCIPSGAQAASRWKTLQNKYLDKKSVNCLIFVKYTGGTKCEVLVYRKAKKANGKYTWKQKLRCNGYVGLEGIGKMREGDMRTPIGVFKPTEAFGILDNPGTALKYTKLNPYLYWSGEWGTYNTMVDSRVLGHIPADSEHLISISPHYNYAINIGYNPDNIYWEGSAIFLHCFGYNPYTGGCVAISQKNMKTVLRTITKKTRVCIYEK